MMHSRAFTLVELVIAVVMVAGIAGAATFSLSQSLRALNSSKASRQAMERAQSAVASVARDVERAVRDGDLLFSRVLVSDRETGSGPADELMLFINDDRPVRAWLDDAEGTDREVQYRLGRSPLAESVFDDPSLVMEEDDPGLTLWRRVDIALDDVPDGGGIVTPVAQGIRAMTIAAFDGEDWSATWDSDRNGLPHAIRVSVLAVDDDERAEAVARRVIPLDRVPLPFVKVVESESGSEGGR